MNFLPHKAASNSFQIFKNIPGRFWLLLGIFTGLYLLLTFLTRLFPYNDLPFHLAAATIYRYYETGDNHFPAYYDVQAFLRPNIFHLIFTGSAIFPSVEIANRFYNALYIILFPLSVFVLIRQVNGNIWFTFPAFLLLYNFNVSWGFVGFYFSIPVSLFILCLVLETLRNNAVWLRILLAIMFVLLYIIHAQMTVFCLLFSGLIYFYNYRKDWKKLASSMLVFLPVLGIMLYWWTKTQGEADTFHDIIRFYKEAYFQTLLKRRSLFYLDNFFLFAGRKGTLVASFFSLFLVVPFLIGLINSRKNLRNIFDNNLRISFLIFLFVTFASFFLPPVHLPGQAWIFHRFSVFVLLSTIVFTSLIFPARYCNTFLGIIIVGILIHFVLYAHKHWDFQQQTAGFTPDFFPEDSKDKTLAGYIINKKFRGYDAFLHFPNYYIVWKKGIAVTSVIDYRFGAIRRKASFETLPYYNEGLLVSGAADFPYKNMDYLLVKGELPEAGKKFELRDFELLKQSGEWQIFAHKVE